MRKQVERCDNFEGFDMFTSLCGGGLGSAFISNLRIDYGKKAINVVAHGPDQLKNSPNGPIEVYNFQNNLAPIIEDASVCTLVTNKQLANYCT